jgi:hypothetical protein
VAALLVPSVFHPHSFQREVLQAFLEASQPLVLLAVQTNPELVHPSGISAHLLIRYSRFQLQMHLTE